MAANAEKGGGRGDCPPRRWHNEVMPHRFFDAKKPPAASAAKCCAVPPTMETLTMAADEAEALRRADAMSDKWGIVPVRRLSRRQMMNLAICGHTRRARSGAEQVRRNADEWKRRGW